MISSFIRTCANHARLLFPTKTTFTIRSVISNIGDKLFYFFICIIMLCTYTKLMINADNMK